MPSISGSFAAARNVFRHLLFLVWAAVVILSLAACSKAKHTDASRTLAQSFQTAEAETKQAAETAATQLRNGNYTEATKALAPVVAQHELTPPQKQAVSLALRQLNEAVAASPSLDTKEMYELRLKLYRAVDGGKRF